MHRCHAGPTARGAPPVPAPWGRGWGYGERSKASVPSNRLLVEVDVNLLGLEILLDAPGAKFASEAGLLVATPRRFKVGGLHVIDPDNAGANLLAHAESLEDVARPDGSGQTERGVIGDAQAIGFVVEGNDGGNGAEDFFARDAGRVVDVIEDRRFNVIALGETLRAIAAGGNLGFFLADFLVAADAVVLFLADQRTHFRFTFHRRTEFDQLGFLGHGLDELLVDGTLDEDAAAGRTDFALVDEDTEESTVDGGFEVSIRKKDVGRFATEFERDALQGVGGRAHDCFADGTAAGEGNLVDIFVGDDGSARAFTIAGDDVDYAIGQAT